jgi:hypothetical protein
MSFFTGRSRSEIESLVNAGADVKKSRPDGVTAIWLAAQVLSSSAKSLHF